MPPPIHIDGNCLAAARSGDQRAWITIYDALSGPLLTYLRRLGAEQRTEAEDLLGETFLQISRDLHKFAGSPNELRPWAFRIARNRLIDASRSLGRRPEGHLEQTFDSPLDGGSVRDGSVLVEQTEYQQVLETEVLNQLLSTLTPDQREVIWLRFVEDLDTESVGHITGRPANAVSAMAQRALASLHTQIQQHSEGL
jgi:RNA polymerase sigma-70 factor (ECF subfamily)